MLLYKYMSLNSAFAVAAHNTIGFRQPKFFNDPFELLGGPSMESDPATHEIPELREYFKYKIWADQTAVLALTRDPLNPLMWAHYGDQHRGVVIGCDVSNEAFTSESSNLIPVQHGSIVYTASRPRGQLLGSKARVTVGQEYAYRPELHEMLQRLFLCKPSCWAYEEEVRVVRALGGPSKMPTAEIGGAPLHLLQMPHGTVREVYLGVRNSAKAEDLRRAFASSKDRLKVFTCHIGNETWDLEGTENAPTIIFSDGITASLA